MKTIQINTIKTLSTFLITLLFSFQSIGQCEELDFQLSYWQSGNWCNMLQVDVLYFTGNNGEKLDVDIDFGDGTIVHYDSVLGVFSSHDYYESIVYTVTASITWNGCVKTKTMDIDLTNCDLTYNNGCGFANFPIFPKNEDGCSVLSFSTMVQVINNVNSGFNWNNTQYTWNLGDGTILTTDEYVPAMYHYYSYIDTTYTVSFTATDGTCTYKDSITVYFPNCQPIDPADSCAHFFAMPSLVDGYFLNYDNKVRFNWKNLSFVEQDARIVITFPIENTPIIDPNSEYPWVISGNEISLEMTMEPMRFYNEYIKFYMPWGVEDSTYHPYTITMELIDPDKTICNENYASGAFGMFVGSAYDPNAKTVNQPKFLDPDVQEEFEYVIYFQNTGTAPAQNIWVRDTLSDKLDWSTFELIKASHNVQVNDLSDGVKEFYFPQIWLPDSTSNLEESQGFVSYKIKELATNQEGDEILNTAYIYFDINDPIVTNTTQNINHRPEADDLGIAQKAFNEIYVSPNPASTSITIKTTDKVNMVEVYSVDGKQLIQDRPMQEIFHVNIQSLDAGVYLLKLTINNNSEVIRIVKQ